jgi:hypothetical protein
MRCSEVRRDVTRAVASFKSSHIFALVPGRRNGEETHGGAITRQIEPNQKILVSDVSEERKAVLFILLHLEIERHVEQIPATCSI